LRQEGEALVSAEGRRWPIVGGVPRFVPSESYTSSFGFEWNVHRTTQLESANEGITRTVPTLGEKTGLAPADVAGKLVLDAGVGSGRFSEVLATWGAKVFGIDLSRAVEAAARNLARFPDATIAQADIGAPPFADGTFDVVVSIGVLHHTEDTRRHFQRLVRLVKPGGAICIWVYPAEDHYLKRVALSPFVKALPTLWFYRFCRRAVPFVLARRYNPIVRYFMDVFPVSDQGFGLENDILDTFDAYSPTFHWVHKPEELERWFREAGLEGFRTFGPPWPTAARGSKPVSATLGAA
jgi:SAM-dependent methyltransferase